MLPLRIAFGHKARSGKDTAGEHLVSKYGGRIAKFAKPLYDVCGHIQQNVGRPVQKEPRLLQAVGQVMRAVYGDDVFAKEAMRGLSPVENVYVTDFRHISEITELRRCGFTLVKIERRDRPIDRDPNHISEVDLDNFTAWDYIVTNDGTIEEFLAKIDEIANTLRYRDFRGR